MVNINTGKPILCHFLQQYHSLLFLYVVKEEIYYSTHNYNNYPMSRLNSAKFEKQSMTAIDGGLKPWRVNRDQTLANRGLNSRFIIKGISKPKHISRVEAQIGLKTQYRGYTNPDFQPDLNLPEYQHAYTNTDSFKDLFFVKIQQYLNDKHSKFCISIMLYICTKYFH